MATDNSLLTFVNGQTGTNVSFAGANSAVSNTGSILISSATCHLVLPPAVSTATAATGEFTIEAWINPRSIATNTGLGGGTSIAVNSNSLGTSLGWNIELWRVSSTTFNLKAYVGGTSSTNSVTGTNAGYAINAWHHIAVVRDKSNVVRLFVDGVPDANTVTYSGTLPDSGTTPFIGKSQIGSAANQYDGYITNFRFVNNRALYSGTFTPSTSPLTSTDGTAILLTAPQNSTGTLYNEVFIQDSSNNNWLVSNASDNSNTTFATLSTLSPFATTLTTNPVITNSIIDSAMYASNSITAIGGSAYSPTAYALKTSQISLNDPMVRALAGIGSGQISFSNFVDNTIYTQTWRSRISRLANYSVPGSTTTIYGWAKDQATANAIIYSNINVLATVGERGNTFGNTAVGLYEPNSPNGANSIPIVGIVSITNNFGPGGVYVYATGNTASTNLHAIRIGANTVGVGNQIYANTTGGYQNFGNATAGNVGGVYYTSGNAAGLTQYGWAGQSLGTNTYAQITGYLANIAAGSPTNTGNVTTFYVT